MSTERNTIFEYIKFTKLQMKETFGNIIGPVEPQIEKGIRSLKLKNIFKDALKPRLPSAELFNDVMNLQNINVPQLLSCLEVIVDHYNITEAK